MAKEKFTLSESQKALILEKFQSGIQDMDVLTKLAWEDQTIDGRHAKGRAVKKFLVENELKYKTLHHERVDKVELTPEMGEQILAEARKGKGHLEIAQIVFPDRQVKKLSREWRAVLNFITAHAPETAMDKTEGDNTTSYLAPKEPSRIIKKINDAVGLNLDPENISGKYKQYVDKLKVNLSNLRFVSICNSYASRKDRDLFEQQFVIHTWDKPDLTAEDVSVYMNVCKDIVTSESLSAHISKLNVIFEDMQDGTELTQRFAETLKAKTSEYQQCMKRITDNLNDLQGERSERLKNRSSGSLSLIGLLEEFQEEKSRRRILELGRREKLLRVKEGERLESISELKARVLGFSIEDVV